MENFGPHHPTGVSLDIHWTEDQVWTSNERNLGTREGKGPGVKSKV